MVSCNYVFSYLLTSVICQSESNTSNIATTSSPSTLSPLTSSQSLETSSTALFPQSSPSPPPSLISSPSPSSSSPPLSSPSKNFDIDYILPANIRPFKYDISLHISRENTSDFTAIITGHTVIHAQTSNDTSVVVLHQGPHLHIDDVTITTFLNGTRAIIARGGRNFTNLIFTKFIFDFERFFFGDTIKNLKNFQKFFDNPCSRPTIFILIQRNPSHNHHKSGNNHPQTSPTNHHHQPFVRV